MRSDEFVTSRLDSTEGDKEKTKSVIRIGGRNKLERTKNMEDNEPTCSNLKRIWCVHRPDFAKSKPFIIPAPDIL